MESTEGAAVRRPDPTLERIQREHELGRAYEAAKLLEERLELAAMNPRPARRIRKDIVETFALLNTDDVQFPISQSRNPTVLIVAGPPCQDLTGDPPIEP